MRASDYRRAAREALRGKWGAMLAVMLLADLAVNEFGLNAIYELFFTEVRTVPLFGDYTYRYLAPVGAGVFLLGAVYAIRAACLVVGVGKYRAASAVYAGERPEAGMLFPMRLVWKMIAVEIVRGVLVGLQMLLLVVPGIIALYRYDMAEYLLLKNPELGPIEALRESRERMRGSKGRLFCLKLSFFGWLFLLGFVLSVANYLLPDAPAAALLYFALSLALQVPMSTYITMSEAAFFRDVYRGAEVSEEECADEMTREEYDAAPAGDPEKVYTALSADETVAKDIFLQHGCSRARLREEGLLEEYEKLNVQPSSEAAWVRDYGDQLMRRFDRDPEALDELLILSAENASAELIDRALQRVERHIRQETLPDQEILDMAGRALAMLNSGAFDGSGGFLGRKRAQISDMADRLEHRLMEAQPDGDWRRALELIRSMGGEE